MRQGPVSADFETPSLPNLNLSSPRQLKSAWKQAVDSLADGLGPVTSYNFETITGYRQYEIVCVNSFSQPTVFAVDRSSLLGKGGQGDVYLAYEIAPDNDLSENLDPVVAKISADQLCSDDFPNEAAMLKRLNRFRGSLSHQLSSTTEHYLFSDCCPGETLYNICYEQPFLHVMKQHLDPLLAMKIAKAIIVAVQKLHQSYEFCILHRDLKPENIMIDIKGDQVVARLVDFGSSCLIQRASKTFKGTAGYQAPELYKKMDIRPTYNLSSEYFSLGVVLAELFSHCNYQNTLNHLNKRCEESQKFLFLSHEEIYNAMPDIFKSIEGIENKVDESWRIYIASKIKHLTALDPNARPTFKDIDKIIRGIDKQIEVYIEKDGRDSNILYDIRKKLSPSVEKIIDELDKMSFKDNRLRKMKSTSDLPDDIKTSPRSPISRRLSRSSDVRASQSDSIPILNFRDMHSKRGRRKTMSPKKSGYLLSPRQKSPKKTQDNAKSYLSSPKHGRGY